MKNLKDLSHPIRSIEDIEHIATISANNDSSVGKLIATMAVDKVGQDGSITIEESRSVETSIDITEGFKIPGWLCCWCFCHGRKASSHVARRTVDFGHRP